MADKPIKTRRKPRRVGPLSRASSLSTVDKRTLAGRILKQVRDELIQHVGGDPTVAELLLIEAAAMKSCRVALLTDQMMEGEISGADPHHILAWCNSLRLDLQVIGLKRVTRDVTPKLEDILRDHAAKGEKTLEGVDLPPHPETLANDALEAAE